MEAYVAIRLKKYENIVWWLQYADLFPISMYKILGVTIVGTNDCLQSWRFFSLQILFVDQSTPCTRQHSGVVDWMRNFHLQSKKQQRNSL